MFVYSCFVVDPAGADRLDLIDEQGCATDRYLMGNIEYPTDLMGVKEVHVFKYADRPALFFQCQINIAVKEPNAECIRPQCAEPEGRGDGRPGRNFAAARRNNRRGKRQADAAATVDVSSRIETLDVDDRKAILPEDLRHVAPAARHLYAPVTLQSSGMCVSTTTFTVLIAIGLAIIAATVSAAVVLNRRQQK
jgi:hypothetical protein